MRARVLRRADCRSSWGRLPSGHAPPAAPPGRGHLARGRGLPDRALSRARGVAIVLDLTRLADEAALEGIRLRHPDASEREQKLRLFALKHGRDLALAAYGWDPLVEGW
jgi:hypothetical protein